ncbi:MAG: hypothetical protein ABIJ56_21885, partial [Pseudomonadota bacterium]
MQEYHEEKGIGPSAGRESSGMTYMEIMVAIAIVALVASGVIVGFSSLSRSRLKSSAYLIIAAAQRGFSYATARNEHVRLTLDLDENTILFESTEGKLLIDKKKLEEEYMEQEEEEEGDEEDLDVGEEAGSGGPSGDFDLGVSTLAERIRDGFHAGEVPKYKPPSFLPIGGRAFAERSLEGGVKFFAVYSQLFEDERREGKVYIYFFPDGTADHTAIQLQA